ncbi:hypothetical protein VHEMI08752 [[Torrubiella] hemipterigena]|uniref:Serine peptidase n=1 Tax=[Torrubiella] hemipterigena TaxID=1531966 RepID=A0A0A1TNT0_9HYPO|nr:hypothetical protein VHEMI08752 [[Torrubiella] hemipterigena]
MVRSIISTIAAACAFAGVAQAIGFGPANTGMGIPSMPEEALAKGDPAAAEASYCYNLYPPSVPCPIVAGTFDQYIDHDKPELGTFKQRYWYNAEFYAGPGSPIILNAPGEEAADYYVWYTTNYTLPGVFAQDNKGAAIFLEHRFWGESSPYKTLTAKTLQLLTLDQAMRDIINFAKKVDLPFTKGTGSPDKSPWILTGGSYPGAVVAWVNKLFPGTFWAYHSSSGVVQPIADYWQYFQPIEAAMPRNCSKDLKLAIKQLDSMMDSRDAAGRTALKSKFGLGDLADDDFASSLIDPLWSWQGTLFYSHSSKLYDMCDYIEGVGNHNINKTEVPGEEGVGGCKALHGLAKYYREYNSKHLCDSFSYWPTGSDACSVTHNVSSPIYTDRTVRNEINLQWQWMCCNEPFQQWQAYVPGDTGLISKYIPTQAQRAQCDLFFPTDDGFTYGLKAGRTTQQIVEKTGGWDNIHTTRLVYVNGEFDPWRQETVSSTIRPGGPLESTPEVPVFLIKGGSHCSDLIMKDAEVNTDAARVIQGVRDVINKWTAEFYTEKGIKRPGF